MEYTTYKDRPAIRVKAGRLTALFLPEDGGKLASLSDGEREYMAEAPGDSYIRLLPDGDYGKAECSGFDDMFPTIDPCEVCGLFYPDHGEVCRYPMQVTERDTKIKFRFESPTMPFVFSKKVWADGDAIVISYRIENTSDKTLPFIWAGHIMLKGEDDGKIITPYPDDAPIEQMFGEKIKSVGERYQLAGFSESGNTYKFYYTEPNGEGYCAYALKNSQLRFKYDAEKVPYLGLWLNNGGFKGMYNVALEPCTALFDSPENAEKKSSSSKLLPGGIFEFELKIELIKEGE